MEFLKKLITAIRGGSRELGEAVLDTQGIRIYEQEIEDAKAAIKQADHEKKVLYYATCKLRLTPVSSFRIV